MSTLIYYYFTKLMSAVDECPKNYYPASSEYYEQI